MVTLGLSITDELKQKVYDSQAAYSDCAMSFDEIPVSLLSNRAVRSDTSSKYFDRSRFEWCARESGRNLKTQIETFIKAKSQAKPMFIVQGRNDPRVPVTEAEQMVKAIRDNGGQCWYLMAKDEGHGFQKKRNADFQFLGTILFYRDHLLR